MSSYPGDERWAAEESARRERQLAERSRPVLVSYNDQTYEALAEKIEKLYKTAEVLRSVGETNLTDLYAEIRTCERAAVEQLRMLVASTGVSEPAGGAASEIARELERLRAEHKTVVQHCVALRGENAELRAEIERLRAERSGSRVEAL